MINWKEIFESQTNVYHCKTKEIALKFLKIAHDYGKEWKSGTSLLEKNAWYGRKEETCYDFFKYDDDNYGCSSGGRKHFIERGYNVIDAETLFNGYYRKPFKLKRK